MFPHEVLLFSLKITYIVLCIWIHVLFFGLEYSYRGYEAIIQTEIVIFGSAFVPVKTKTPNNLELILEWNG